MILILNYFEGVVAAESSSTVSSSCACVHRECFTMSVCAHESARVCVCSEPNVKRRRVQDPLSVSLGLGRFELIS